MSGKPEKPASIIPPLTALTDEARTRALARFRLLQPCVEDGVPLARLARQQGMALRTAQRWLQRYRQHGLAGLVRQTRADRGHHRRLTPELQQLIEGLALRTPPPTAAYVHRQVAAVATQRGWPIPSYRSVSAIIKQLDPGLLTLAHQGTKAYRERFDLLYRREAAKPNEIWQADHSLLAIWLCDHEGQPARPWLTVIMDDYSRAIAGFGISFQAPSALQTALVLRQAIWRKATPQWHVCGIPARFYTDRGSDFTSTHLEQVSADLKMVPVFSEPGMPRGRGRIERFFQTIEQLLLCRLPGYAPAGTPPPTPTLALPGFEVHVHAFIVEEYHQRPHGETGIPPQVRWEAGGFLPHLPESLEQLDLLLLTVAKPRRVQRDGIRFHGFRYLDPTLAAYVGEDVVIRFDPRDMAEIRVYHRNTFLCHAVCQELAGSTISLQAIEQARNHRRKALRQTLRSRAALVETLLRVHQPDDGVGPPAEPPRPVEAPRLKRYEHE
jgi:putative transposase